MEKFVPRSAQGAPVRCMAVSAHKDDVEMIAIDGIFRCCENGGFAAAVLTDGGQCPRSEAYAAVSDEDMAELRSAEQKRAAEAGRYEALWLFERTSAEVKRTAKEGGGLVAELAAVLSGLPRLETLYLHNPFDSCRRPLPPRGQTPGKSARLRALAGPRLAGGRGQDRPRRQRFGRTCGETDVVFRLAERGQTL